MALQSASQVVVKCSPCTLVWPSRSVQTAREMRTRGHYHDVTTRCCCCCCCCLRLWREGDYRKVGRRMEPLGTLKASKLCWFNSGEMRSERVHYRSFLGDGRLVCRKQPFRKISGWCERVPDVHFTGFQQVIAKCRFPAACILAVYGGSFILE